MDPSAFADNPAPHPDPNAQPRPDSILDISKLSSYAYRDPSPKPDEIMTESWTEWSYEAGIKVFERYDIYRKAIHLKFKLSEC